MFVLVYAPSGVLGEDGSKAIVTDTLAGAQFEMYRQVIEYVDECCDEGDEPFIDTMHAVGCPSWPDSPEWHIYKA